MSQSKKPDLVEREAVKKLIDDMLDVQFLWIVIPGTLVGSPAFTAATLAMLFSLYVL